MGYKYFISYKYRDTNVKELPNVRGVTRVRDYVDYIGNFVLGNNYINKSESTDDDLSRLGDDYIWTVLKDKIYDSSVTIVLISPNMKNPGQWQRSQWIPWEISYSLRLTTRDDRTSQRNAILAVVLPDHNGSLEYYDPQNLFPILSQNIRCGYVHVTSWHAFINNPGSEIKRAIERKAFYRDVTINL